MSSPPPVASPSLPAPAAGAWGDAPPADAPPAAPPGSPLSTVMAAMAAADAAAASGSGVTADAAVVALLAGVRALGFGRVLLEARDARGERAGVWVAGIEGAAPAPVGAGVWRRWQRLLARGAPARPAGADPDPLDGLDGLDGVRWFGLGRDPWARAEFGSLFGPPAAPDAGAPVGAPPHEGPPPEGVLFVLSPPAADGARALLAAAHDGPGALDAEAARAAAVLARAAAGRLDRARLAAVADARAERLRGLHAAGMALARSRDPGAVVQELALQVGRLVPHDGLVVAEPDLAGGAVRTLLREVGGRPRPRPALPLGAGPLAEAARTGAPVRVDEYDPARSALAAADDVVGDGGPARSVLAVPMRVGTRLAGVLAVHAAAPAAFGDEDVEVLRTVAAQAAVALANAAAFADSDAERRQSDALVALARAVGGSRRPGEVLRLGLRHTLALLGAEGAFVALRPDGRPGAAHPAAAPLGDHLHVVAGAGSAERLAGALLAVGDTVPGRAAAGAGAAVVDNDVAAAGHAGFPLQDVARVARLAAVPLVTGDGVIGVLAAVNRAEPFGEADARVLGRLAELLAVAAVNARLFASVEEATREWRVAFDATGAGMVVLDPDGWVVRANVRAAELLGAGPPQALLGASFTARLCGDAHTPEGAELRALAAGGRRGRARVRVPNNVPGAGHGAGRVFDVLVSPHPAGGCVATFDDVTAQVALAERYRLVVETSRDALLITDREGTVAYANAAAEALFGRGPGLVGSHTRALVRPDEVGPLQARIQGEWLDRPQSYEFTTVRPDGTERLLAASTAPLRELGDAGRASGVVAALRDVTDERAAARQLAEREKLAAIGQLVGGVAHELNNPLAGVLAMSELLLAEPLLADHPEHALTVSAADRRELHDLAATVHREARRAARTVSRLLDFARQHAPRRAAADVNAALAAALDLRRSSLRLARVEVALALDPALPPAWADAHQLEQVFLNLLTNAEHALAGHAGERRLTLATRGRTRDGAPRVVVEVRDTGPGLAPGDAARVFEPFYTTKPAGQGTGLGLAVSAGIVREHGGEIRAAPAPGGGAAFVVELPAAAAAADAAPGVLGAADVP